MFRMQKINQAGVLVDMVEDLEPSNATLKVFQVTGQVGEYTNRQLSYSKCTEDSFELKDVNEDVSSPYLEDIGTYCIDDIDEVLLQGSVSDKDQNFIEILLEACN